MAATYTADDLTLHISRLGLAHGVRVDIARHHEGLANRHFQMIRVPPIKSPVSYAIALHEMGHCVGEYPGDLLGKEAAAWEWAKANALFWNASMQDFMEFALMTYVRAEGKGSANVDALLNV